VILLKNDEVIDFLTRPPTLGGYFILPHPVVKFRLAAIDRSRPVDIFWVT